APRSCCHLSNVTTVTPPRGARATDALARSTTCRPRSSEPRAPAPRVSGWTRLWRKDVDVNGKPTPAFDDAVLLSRRRQQDKEVVARYAAGAGQGHDIG